MSIQATCAWRVLSANSATGCSAEKRLSRKTASAPGLAPPFAATRDRAANSSEG